MQYNYQARTQDGEIQTGTVEAGGMEGAIDILQRHNLIVISITPEAEVSLFSRRLKIFERVSTKSVVMFSRQLSTMVEAKISLVQSLRALVRQQDNKYFKEIIYKIASDVEGGASFSDALARHPKIFAPFYISIIRSGEVSGRVEESLGYLADHLESQYDLMNKIKGAMMYPILIIVGFGAVGFVMMAFVLPQLLEVFEEADQELPWMTKLLIFTSDIFAAHWLLILVGIVGGFLALKYYIGTPNGKKNWDFLKLKMPIVGKISQKIYLARFSENLSTLITSGLPITKSLKITGDVVGNEIYKEMIFEAADRVKAGDTIAGAFEGRKEVPPMVAQMISVGEKTGKLDFTLQGIARFYGREVQNAIDSLTTLIEPILILVLGAGVGILVSAILVPIYNLTATF